MAPKPPVLCVGLLASCDAPRGSGGPAEGLVAPNPFLGNVKGPSEELRAEVEP